MNINKKIKKALSFILSFAMIFMFTQPVLAKDTTQSDEDYSAILNEYGLDGELIEKVLDVSEHIFFNENGTSLLTDLSDDDLSETYEFTNRQIADFHSILDGTYQPPDPTKTMPITRANRFYLSNSDLTAGVFAILGTAAAAGPAALMAAWTSISSALAGPLGTIAGLAVSALGYAFFADLALKITGALAQGKGVAFYLEWGFPPVRAEIE